LANVFINGRNRGNATTAATLQKASPPLTSNPPQLPSSGATPVEPARATRWSRSAARGETITLPGQTLDYVFLPWPAADPTQASVSFRSPRKK